MTTLRILLFAAVLWPTAASAQAIRLRSGEHADFDRIVLYLQPPPDWQAGRVTGGFEVRVDTDRAFDLGAVYQFITRDRIAQVEAPGDGRLRLLSACDCHAEVFAIPQGLVIDVKDGPPPADSPFEQALQPWPGEAIAADTPDVPVEPAETARETPAATSSALRLPLVLIPSPALLLPGFAPQGIEHPAPDHVATAEPAVTHGATLATVRAELVEQLARAASQGLVDFRPPAAKANDAPAPNSTPVRPETAADHAGDTDHPSSAPADTTTAEHRPATETAASEHADPDGFDNLRIQSVIDRDFGSGAHRRHVTTTGAPCIDPALLDIASWGKDPNPRPDLAAHRTDLLDPFDVPVADAVHAEVRYYLYLGFGAEAAADLRAFQVSFPDAGILDEIAQIMDHGHALVPQYFANQVSCESRAAMWAVLARETLSPGDPVDASAVIAAFGELPLHLRRHLGPDLAERFLAAGDAQTAGALRNIIARAPGEHGDGLRLLDAHIAIGEGRDEGVHELTDLATGNGPKAPEALVQLIDRHVAEGTAVPPDRTDLAAALAREHRGTPLGRQLAGAHVAGLIAGGRLAEAFDELGHDGTAALPPGARAALADRLVALGLPGAARQVLADRPDPPDARAWTIIATSYLAEADGARALQALSGLTGPQADALRARALIQTGESDAAAALYEAVGDDAAAARAAWRAADWSRVGRLGDDLQKAMAERMTEDAAPADPAHPGPGSEEAHMPEQSGAPQLDEARRLADDSRATRDLIQALLNSGPSG